MGKNTKDLIKDWIQEDHTQYLLGWMLTLETWIRDFRDFCKVKGTKIKATDEELMNLFTEYSDLKFYIHRGFRGDIVDRKILDYIVGVTDKAKDESYRHCILEPLNRGE